MSFGDGCGVAEIYNAMKNIEKIFRALFGAFIACI
jgi:hypothetical protein